VPIDAGDKFIQPSKGSGSKMRTIVSSHEFEAPHNPDAELAKPIRKPEVRTTPVMTSYGADVTGICQVNQHS
jgi:hypothetical protein